MPAQKEGLKLSSVVNLASVCPGRRTAGGKWNVFLVVHQCPALSQRENRQFSCLLTYRQLQQSLCKGGVCGETYSGLYNTEDYALILSKLHYYMFTLYLEAHQDILQQDKILPVVQGEH